MNVVHDALKQIFRLVVDSIRTFAIRQWRVVLKVELGNVVETTHQGGHCTENAVEENRETPGDGDLALDN